MGQLVYPDGHWVSFTPTLMYSGTFSLGNGTLSGKYMMLNKTCFLAVALYIGSTTNTNTSTGWYFNCPAGVPVPKNDPLYPQAIGTYGAYDATGPVYVGVSRQGQNSPNITCGAAYLGSAPGYVGSGGLAYNTPFTWAVGDYLTAQLTFETN